MNIFNLIFKHKKMSDEVKKRTSLPETEEQREEATEKKTVEEKDAEPLYQKKVYIVDLNNIGLKIEGEGSLVVDVMEVKNGKATVKNGDLTMEVPKEFLF